MLEGSTVALVTPFKDGKFDEKSYANLVEFQIKQGTDVIVPCGTTGESATLTHEEQNHVVKFTCEVVNKRVKVLAGAGSNCTAEAVELTKFAKKVGADAALSITPYYNKPTQNGLYAHFEAVAKGVGDFPVVLYNVPGRTSVNLLPETVAKLSKIKNIVAIKEASGSLDQVGRILELCNIMVLSGDDSLTLPMMALGAKGVISVVANIIPKDVSDMIKAFNKNDLEKARKLHFKMLPIFKNMFIETNPIPVKTALHKMGMIRNEYRLPLCELEPKNDEKVTQVLKEYGLIK